MFFYKLLFLFIIGSTFGFILELFFRRFFSAKAWINPGFLSGPTLPLYGFSLVAIYSFTILLNNIQIKNVAVKSLVIILILTIIVTFIEMITGLFFQNIMKVKLWDYSNRFLNFKGVICPLFSAFWMVIIAIYYLFIHKFIQNITEVISSERITLIFLFGLYYGVLICDVVSSFNLMTKIRSFALSENIKVKLVSMKANVVKATGTIKGKLCMVLPIKNVKVLLEHIKTLTKDKEEK